MWKSIVESDRPQTTLCGMNIARWITKVTNTHSEHVTLIVFPQKKRLHERASLLSYSALPVLCS